MSTSRRTFCVSVGAVAGLPWLWHEAEAQVAATGEVSADIVRALLDLQGSRGIYDDPDRFEELRAAVARVVRTSQRLRTFPIPDDIQPALVFKRG
ncbi:MAG: hypothetical protein IMZ55_00885 [Acidobacteria bacterium]|nr:hypothetical protein [Acidobacteriota bacterium]